MQRQQKIEDDRERDVCRQPGVEQPAHPLLELDRVLQIGGGGCQWQQFGAGLGRTGNARCWSLRVGPVLPIQKAPQPVDLRLLLADVLRDVAQVMLADEPSEHAQQHRCRQRDAERTLELVPAMEDGQQRAYQAEIDVRLQQCAEAMLPGECAAQRSAALDYGVGERDEHERRAYDAEHATQEASGEEGRAVHQETQPQDHQHREDDRRDDAILVAHLRIHRDIGRRFRLAGQDHARGTIEWRQTVVHVHGDLARQQLDLAEAAVTLPAGIFDRNADLFGGLENGLAGRQRRLFSGPLEAAGDGRRRVARRHLRAGRHCPGGAQEQLGMNRRQVDAQLAQFVADRVHHHRRTAQVDAARTDLRNLPQQFGGDEPTRAGPCRR